MKVKVKKLNEDGVVRLESSGKIGDVMINEDFLHSEEASIALGFRGKNSSGIVEFSAKEMEDLIRKIRPRMHLLKDVKVMRFDK